MKCETDQTWIRKICLLFFLSNMYSHNKNVIGLTYLVTLFKNVAIMLLVSW